MMKRRDFLTATGAALVCGSAACGASGEAGQGEYPPFKNRQPQTALMVWYSQTGHTARMGKLAAKVLEAQGIAVTTGTLKQTDPQRAADFDLVMIGSPVQYMDLPENVAAWLDALPRLDGIAVAGWVTYGGQGHNEVNSSAHIMEELTARGAVPAGMAQFGNLNTFAPFWASDSGKKRTLGYRHLPNEQTYAQCRKFAADTLASIRTGKPIAIAHKLDLAGWLTPFNPMWWTKKMIGRHEIDPQKCIDCGTCVRVCPVDAIAAASKRIDHEACLACLGCLNNCPANAVVLEFAGKPTTGFIQLCQDNGIVIQEPSELMG